MDVKEIKEEIKQEETFLLKLFQLEKIAKKYKKQLIALGVLIVVAFFGYQINGYLQTQKLIKTNMAYNKLLVNPTDKQALQVLKQNDKLFKLYLLQTSNNDITKLQKVASANGIVANIAKYQIAVLKGDQKDIQNYALSIDSIYKDLALLNVERILLQEKKHKQAENIVKQISDENVMKIATSLLHYGIVK